MSKSTSGSLFSPWLWKGPVSFSEIGPSSCDAAAPVASSFALRSRFTLPLSTFFFPLNVWSMSCWALSSRAACVAAARRQRQQWARPGRARAAEETASAKSWQGGPSFRRPPRHACVLAVERATGACGENEGQHTRPPLPMRWSGHIRHSPSAGPHRRRAAALAARAAMLPAPASGARKPDPVITTIDRALARGRDRCGAARRLPRVLLRRAAHAQRRSRDSGGPSSATSSARCARSRARSASRPGCGRCS